MIEPAHGLVGEAIVQQRIRRSALQGLGVERDEECLLFPGELTFSASIGPSFGGPRRARLAANTASFGWRQPSASAIFGAKEITCHERPIAAQD